MTLRIGVIGTGAIGKDHIRRINEVLTGGKVIAVADICEAGPKAIAEKYGVKTYKNGADLINDPEVDAIVVTTPGFAHKDPVLQAIAAGKPVFTEKPLSTTAADCKEIVNAEIAGGKHLVQVGFMRRYDKGYNQVKAMLDSGEFGVPLILHCTHRNPEVDTSYTTPMAVHDTAIHEIDVLHWLIDDEYESAQVIMPVSTKYTHSKLKDPQLMILRTKKGICIEIEVFVNCEVVCEDGVVKMPAPSTPITRKNGLLSTGIETNWKNRFIDAYDVELQDWINSAGKGEINGPTAWDGYLASMTADALVKAQTSGAIEPITTGEMPEFYAK
ncbi:myo-inositol 2-dehydrogenase/D-chiro-inositol 1-dehydrogenase [Clostridium algifaecis]|uniref:Inositol 2-dehydrogenase/D-chiro-inositol 3-dehydrogenase n=1 Tax=Clostridium algifaecis TaxID=1472040 RepID=A0ABS4KVR1_9CLOT|nr:Gfo/Idh/MocA family oxidoreductase [Clostridium algifaecis]MBP2034092.1 myo-inositol 2-dehydrogenase/D-chiro-inositol 1-dehydrogenase [Clostridium algifaecis]